MMDERVVRQGGNRLKVLSANAASWVQESQIRLESEVTATATAMQVFVF